MSVASKPFTTRDLTAALAVVIIWGLNFVATKQGLRHFTPLQLGVARFLLSAFPLILLVRPPKVGLVWLVSYGLLQGVGQFGLLFFALQVGMSAALAAVLMQMQVFVTAVLAWLMLGERISRPLQIGLALAGAGLACFAVTAIAPDAGSGVTLAGLVLNLLAASMWACSNIVVRGLQLRSVHYDALGLVVWSSMVSSLVFLALSLLVDPPEQRWAWTEAPLHTWLAVLYIGWGANVVGYWLWTSLLRRHPANRIAPFSLAVPVVGLVAGIVLLGERVTPWQWAGAVLVMSALIFVFRGGARR